MKLSMLIELKRLPCVNSCFFGVRRSLYEAYFVVTKVRISFIGFESFIRLTCPLPPAPQY